MVFTAEAIAPHVASAQSSSESEARSALNVHVVRVDAGHGSAPTSAALVAFSNATDNTVTVTHYRVTWPGGSRDVTESFVVEPHSILGRTIALGYLGSDTAAVHVVVLGVRVRSHPPLYLN